MYSSHYCRRFVTQFTKPLRNCLVGVSFGEEIVKVAFVSSSFDRDIHIVTPRYRLRLAENLDDVRAAQSLRFEVFNLELNEGLESSFRTELDMDPFDEVCDHILVESQTSDKVVGTYRLQRGSEAVWRKGFYSAQEFDFAPFERFFPQIIELGRACVAKDHRNMAVLGLLWRGIAEYATEANARYLIGCSSVHSSDGRHGPGLFAKLAAAHLAPMEWRTRPLPPFACASESSPDPLPYVPKLLRTYLSLGAKICGPPALDRDFQTIDFLTLLDLETLSDTAREHFFRISE
jgi:putative hemolysin